MITRIDTISATTLLRWSNMEHRKMAWEAAQKVTKLVLLAKVQKWAGFKKFLKQMVKK